MIRSGILFDGFIFRFAACQFGQKTAGSPLGCLVRAVASFFARLTEPAHTLADALIFGRSTPEHDECAGFEGCGAVCGPRTEGAGAVASEGPCAQHSAFS